MSISLFLLLSSILNSSFCFSKYLYSSYKSFNFVRIGLVLSLAYSSTMSRCVSLLNNFWCSCCPDISSILSIMFFKSLTVTVKPLILEMLLLLFIFLLTIIISSLASISYLLRISRKESLFSNINSTKALSSSFLIISFENLAPRAILIEPSNKDLPAPVSPVNILSPFSKDTSMSFINAKFFTCKLSSILLLSVFCK